MDRDAKGCTAVALSLAVLLGGCWDSNREGPVSVKAREASGSLEVRKFPKLGIRITLPRDAMDVKANYGKSWEERFHRKSLSFVLLKVPLPDPCFSEARLIEGHVSIYSPEQYQQWKLIPSAHLEGGELFFIKGFYDPPPEVFDTLRTNQFSSLKEVLGFATTVYRVDRRAPDGRVLQAMITRAYYTNDEKKLESDLRLMKTILYNVEFIK